MTDRYKNALSALLRLKKYTGHSNEQTFKEMFLAHIDAIESALTLATESEQLRKERDDLAKGFQYLDALHRELGIVDLTKETARCREIAKKVNENGNA